MIRERLSVCDALLHGFRRQVSLLGGKLMLER